MSIAMAYITVILVWTTTPLGVTWSSETINPTVAALLRMVIAAFFGWFLLRAMGRKLCWSLPAVKKYLAADIGIAGAMYATYQAASLIPSGLISVIYGLSPMLSALIAQYILKEESLTASKMVASILALVGLGMIFGVSDMTVNNLNSELIEGVGLLLLAVALFSLSGVLVKKSSFENDHFEQTVGALVLAIPIYCLMLVIELVTQPTSIKTGVEALISDLDGASSVSVLSVVYLAVMGSLVGFVCYFYILSELSPSTVALTTLVTPVLALMMGACLNNEQVSSDVWFGTGVILFALVLFNWGGMFLKALKGVFRGGRCSFFIGRKDLKVERGVR
jgi:drug/metabolite transporter (DMT)-like permease